MANFSQEKSEFERHGTYSYDFDQAGNIVLNPSSSNFSEVYVSLPVNNFLYDTKKIESFYNANFEEFIPTSMESGNASTVSSADIADMELEVSKLSEENKALTEQLNGLIAKSEQNSTEAERESFKQVILDLRIQLGEGTTEQDFEEDFPYGPKEEAPPAA
jgi:hypothetical protein